MHIKYKPNAESGKGELDSLATPHTTTAGVWCQTASLFLCVSKKHPAIEKSEGRREGTGGGETKGPEKITCCSFLPRYLWTRAWTRLLRALVWRAANRFYPGVETAEGQAAGTLPCWQIYMSKNAGLNFHWVLNLKLIGSYRNPPLILILTKSMLLKSTTHTI